MQESNKSVFLFADLAPAYQEAIQKGIGYDGTSYTLKDGTKITIVAEGYEVVTVAGEVVAPGIVDVGDGLIPAPENDLAKAPVEALAPAAEVVAATGGSNEEVKDAVTPTLKEDCEDCKGLPEGEVTVGHDHSIKDAAATNEVVPEANTEVAPTTENAPEQSTASTEANTVA